MDRLTLYIHIVDESRRSTNHVSIAYEDNGKTKHLGLYPAASDYVKKAKRDDETFVKGKSDAHENIDNHRPITYSRSVKLDKEQIDRFTYVTQERHEYRRDSFDCVSYGLCIWQYVTGEVLIATEERHDDILNPQKITYAETTVGLYKHLREIDKVPHREPTVKSQSEKPAPQQRSGIVGRLLGILVGRLETEAAEQGIPQEPSSEEKEKIIEARAASIAKGIEDRTEWVNYWTSERIAAHVNDLHGNAAIEHQKAYSSRDNETVVDADKRIEAYEAAKARRQAEAEADVAAGRAEHKFSNKNAPYVQYYDEAGKPTHRVVRDWGMLGDEDHPYREGFKTPKPNDPMRIEILPEGYRLDTRSKSHSNSNTRRGNRMEYQPGSHKPAPKEPGRDKDDRGGRGD